MNYNTIIKIDFEEYLILYGKVPGRMFINKPKYKFVEYYPNCIKNFCVRTHGEKFSGIKLLTC